MPKTTAAIRKRARNRVLIVDQNRTVAERRAELLRTAGFEINHACSENELYSLLHHRHYDLVLLAFDSRTDPEKATTLCRKLELLSPMSVVGWLVSDVTLKPQGYCPTLVEEGHGPVDFIKRIKALTALGQKCRAVCVMSEEGECEWGLVDVDTQRGLLPPKTRAFIKQIRTTSGKGVTTPDPKRNSHRS